MKTERSNVKFPLWRKKVDSSLFQHKGTTIPTWACNMWEITEQFNSCISKRDIKSRVLIEFEKEKYKGWVTCAKKGRVTPAYRLWFTEDLQYKIKDVFLMSFMRDIEHRSRKKSGLNIEDEIPFWEFLDIEYDVKSNSFYFNAYYKQNPSFPELFKRLIGSPMLHKIDDELHDKPVFRIYPQCWKPRDYLDSEIEADNVLYTLIDTKNHLIYAGEASNLKSRLRQKHPSIKDWDYYKYNSLPKTTSNYQRIMLERMNIRDFAYIINNKLKINHIDISKYHLVNDKV